MDNDFNIVWPIFLGLMLAMVCIGHYASRR